MRLEPNIIFATSRPMISFAKTFELSRIGTKTYCGQNNNTNIDFLLFKFYLNIVTLLFRNDSIDDHWTNNSKYCFITILFCNNTNMMITRLIIQLIISSNQLHFIFNQILVLNCSKIDNQKSIE